MVEAVVGSRSEPEQLDEVTGGTLWRLLADAGLGTSGVVVRRMWGIGRLNRHWRVQVAGRDLVLRDYGWPFLPPAPARAQHEAAVLGLLEDAQVPAPRVLAIADEALLVTFEQGRVLGELAPDELAAGVGDVWADVGRAWRGVHRIVPDTQLRALLLGGPQRRVAGWYERVVTDVEAHLQAVDERRPGLEVDAERVRRLFALARQLLESRPERLLHGDAHLWNILVDHQRGRWVCTAILDWEAAEVGDPMWDLVGLDLLRRRDIGPTPSAFFEAYGSRVPDLVRGLYELVFHLWQAVDVDAWSTPLPSHRAAETYLADLPAHLTRLEVGLSRLG